MEEKRKFRNNNILMRGNSCCQSKHYSTYFYANNAKKLEQRLKEIEELEIAAEQMKHLIHELRVQVEQEKEKQTELMFSNREQASKIEFLTKELTNRDRLIAEF